MAAHKAMGARVMQNRYYSAKKKPMDNKTRVIMQNILLDIHNNASCAFNTFI
jgi:hypothetical protein